MDTLIDWLELLVRVGLGIGLVAFCAMNAKRVGAGAWLLGSLGAVNVVLSLLFRAISLVHLEHAPYAMLRLTDAGFTVIAAMLSFVGLLMLRG